MHVQCTGQVNGDQLLPIGRRGLEERLEDIPSGIIDEHVDRPERRGHAGYRGADPFVIGNVAGESGGLSTLRCDRRDSAFGRRKVDVEDRNICTLSRKTPAGRAADATTAAGHDDHFRAQSSHVSLPSI